MSRTRALRASLLVLALCAAAVAAGDKHGQRREGDDHDDDDHDDHASHEGEELFEWAGSFALASGVHTLTLGRAGSNYAASSLKILVMHQGGSTMTEIEEVAHPLMEHSWSVANCPWLDHDDHSEHNHRREGDGHECPTVVTLAGLISLSVSGGTMEPRSYVLQTDRDSVATLFKIDVDTPGSYVIFAQHAMAEFEGSMHYLKGPGGLDVYPLFELPEKKACVGDTMSMTQVWGYSMAGATIAAAASLAGAILIILFVARGRPYSEFSIDALGDVSIINAFPAGILLGLVFLHILPESVALAGKFDWRLSTLIVSGFLLGLATEHILNVMGLHHAHAGHSTTSAATVQPDLDVPSAMEQGGIEMVVASPQDAGAATSAIPVALPADEKAAAQAEHMVIHAHHSPIVVNILVGDFFHNLFDGIAIGSAFLSCGGLGWVVTASVVVHELPQELSDFIILVKSGLPVSKALLFNLLSSLSSVVGVVIAVSIGQSSTDSSKLNEDVGLMLAFSAGILLYVAVGLGGELPKVAGRGASLGAWFALAVGVSIIGVLKLWHVHCEACSDSHEGHNH